MHFLMHSVESILPHADRNECALFRGGCQHTCTNTEGSYNCSCFPGYTLKEDGFSCQGMKIIVKLAMHCLYLSIDTDECALNNGGCQHKCINTDGSYYCSCDTGYDLQQDKHSCQGTSVWVCVSISQCVLTLHQKSMSACWTMEVVSTSVSTLMEATTAPVTLVMICNKTSAPVKVLLYM